MELSAQDVVALMARCSVAQGALLGRLVALQGSVAGDGGSGDDRLLAPEEVASRLGVTVTWLYRHAARLPFTRRLSRKALRFSERGLDRWQAQKRG